LRRREKNESKSKHTQKFKRKGKIEEIKNIELKKVKKTL